MINVKCEETDIERSPYVVLYGDYGNENADTPSKAIALWFKYEKTNRADAAIIAFEKSKAIELMDWAYNNKEKIKQLHSKYDNPYKLDYILDSIDRHHGDDYKYFHEGESGDQIDPFSFG